MVDLEKIRIFYYVAMESSILKASAMLGLSSPSVSKHISGLESKLNVKLFIRRRRGLKLTDAGEKLLSVANHAIKDLEEVSKDISHKESRIPNVLRIITTNGITCLWVIGKIKKFLNVNPNIKIKLYTRDDQVDFLSSMADVGILPQVKDTDGVSLRKLNTFVFKLFASKEYLQKMGIPKNLQDLENHHMLSFYHEQIGFRGDMDWHLRLADKIIYPKITINNAFGLFEAARQGLGIFPISPEFPYLQFSDLVEVLGDQAQLENNSYFITRSDQLDNLMIKQFYDCCSVE
jgi:DNA-binding transcriptional LysR family regulator